jgi:hypothetical protein
MEQYQSAKALQLEYLEMDENHCRALGAYSRPDLEIEVIGCQLRSAGTSALVGVLGSSQGPTKLAFCDIDCSVLADGLRGNSRLKSLTSRSPWNLEVGNQQVLAIAAALQESKGLVDLDFRSGLWVNDETWGAITSDT